MNSNLFQALNGTMITGGGSGATTPATIDAPFNALQRQAKIDRTLLYWDFVRQDPSVNPTSDACIVFINEQASEGWDRPSLADSYSDTLVENVARKCNNTHVVIHNAGIRLVDRWIENPNITAVIFAHLPGQETGQAIVDVFYGHQSPSGRLPYTVAKNESDYGQILNPDVPTNATDGHLQSNFTEGVYIDYRHFLAQNITPRYEFGFGLTYSDFTYSDIAVKSLLRNDSVAYRLNSTTLGGIEGGDPSLWDVVATVSCTIRNTGTVAAAEVAQLYVHIPGGPDRVLRGFEKRLLQADESAQLSFELTRRDVSEWDVHTQSWRIPSGTHEVMLGKSVLDIHLHATLTM
jgi:beta-glucosidase